MVRTLLLLLGFAWSTQESARFGDTVLAANHVQLQLVWVCAFFLDGFAFAAETLVGAAAGARSVIAPIGSGPRWASATPSAAP